MKKRSAKKARQIKDEIKTLTKGLGPEPYVNSSEWFPWNAKRSRIASLQKKLETA